MTIIQIDPDLIRPDYQYFNQRADSDPSGCPASEIVKVSVFGTPTRVPQNCTRDRHPDNPLHVAFGGEVQAAWIDTNESPLPSLLDPNDFKDTTYLESAGIIGTGERFSVCGASSPKTLAWACTRDSSDRVHLAHSLVGEPLLAAWVTE